MDVDQMGERRSLLLNSARAIVRFIAAEDAWRRELVEEFGGAAPVAYGQTRGRGEPGYARWVVLNIVNSIQMLAAFKTE